MGHSTLIALLGILSLSPPIRLDKAINSAGDIGFTRQHIFVSDGNSNCLYQLDHTGVLMSSYCQRGQGPEEFQKLRYLAITESEVGVADFGKRSLILFSHDLVPRQEIRVGMPCSDLVLMPDDLFVLGFDPKTKKMIHRFSRSGKKLVSFGDPLKPMDEMFGMQSGFLAVQDRKIYFVHAFRFRIDVFDLHGKQVDTITHPGFPGTLLDDVFRKGELNWWNDMYQVITGFAVSPSGDLLVSYRNFRENRFLLYHREQTKTPWKVQSDVGPVVLGPNGELLQKRSSKDGSDVIELKRIDLK
ncbi:6-bladed beta-propeller [Sulfidibacter corallicola]|uniref:6-bladed beta-propeller n=1 Tax=Sulfidibacter corallicola TaxID=2818388 RepID=A0A8A4TIN8_SULCO|nr:6-bladed beta-propeller [Sulfidibacter corallicola]QTD49899.1 6-bladed beta-propeller [Sulfidibacter corallicola]